MEVNIGTSFALVVITLHYFKKTYAKTFKAFSGNTENFRNHDNSLSKYFLLSKRKFRKMFKRFPKKIF